MLPLNPTYLLGGLTDAAELLRPVRQIGPGKRSVLTLHRKIEADARRDTPGARRARDVVERRRANWAK